ALYDSTQNQLRVKALEFPANEDFFIEGETLPLDGHPAGRAFTTRQTVVLDGVRPDESPVSNRFAAAGIKSACIVPLIAHDRALGILSVGSRAVGAFGEEDVELLDQIAKQVAIAVENALAFRKIEALKNQLNAEKLYLEEEIRTEYNFEEIIGNSTVL